MDEKYIKDIYDNFGEEVLGSFENFANLISTDKEYQQEVYDGLGGEEIFGSYDNYSTLVNTPEFSVDGQPVKKKRRAYGFHVGKWFIGAFTTYD